MHEIYFGQKKLFLVIFWCSGVTSVTFSSNLRNFFVKNVKKIFMITVIEDELKQIGTKMHIFGQSIY